MRGQPGGVRCVQREAGSRKQEERVHQRRMKRVYLPEYENLTYVIFNGSFPTLQPPLGSSAPLPSALSGALASGGSPPSSYFWRSTRRRQNGQIVLPHET